MLRQPIEDEEVTIAKLYGNFTYSLISFKNSFFFGFLIL